MSVPNQLTLLRIAAAPLVCITLVLKWYVFKYVALFIFIFAAITDWWDGHLARKSGKVTPFGIFLDPLADKILVSTAFGMFAYLNYIPDWMFWLIMARDIIITALRTYITRTGKIFNTMLIAKWKTAVQMTAIYLIFIWIIAKETYIHNGTDIPLFMQNIENWNLIYKLMLSVTSYTVLSAVPYLIENRRALKQMFIACYRVFLPTNVR